MSHALSLAAVAAIAAAAADIIVLCSPAAAAAFPDHLSRACATPSSSRPPRPRKLQCFGSRRRRRRQRQTFKLLTFLPRATQFALPAEFRARRSRRISDGGRLATGQLVSRFSSLRQFACLALKWRRFAASRLWMGGDSRRLETRDLRAHKRRRQKRFSPPCLGLLVTHARRRPRRAFSRRRCCRRRGSRLLFLRRSLTNNFTFRQSSAVVSWSTRFCRLHTQSWQFLSLVIMKLANFVVGRDAH